MLHRKPLRPGIDRNMSYDSKKNEKYMEKNQKFYILRDIEFEDAKTIIYLLILNAGLECR